MAEKGSDESRLGSIAGYTPDVREIDGYRTRYFDIGEGDPLVLLHGGNWGGFSNANTWSTVFDRLAERFRVVAFDRVGCGRTEGPDDLEEYRYKTELEHAFACLDALDVDRGHVCGMSRGGGLATTMAVEEPKRFETLVVTNSGTLGPPTGDKERRRGRIFDHVEQTHEPTDPEYVRQKHAQYCHQTEHITDEFCRSMADLRNHPEAERINERLDAGGRERYLESMREQMAETRRRILRGELTLPTLYVFGHNDLTVPLQMGLSAFNLMAQENPDVRMKLVNHCGHFPYREHPDEFAQTVIDFVDQWVPDFAKA